MCSIFPVKSPDLLTHIVLKKHHCNGLNCGVNDACVGCLWYDLSNNASKSGDADTSSS